MNNIKELVPGGIYVSDNITYDFIIVLNNNEGKYSVALLLDYNEITDILYSIADNFVDIYKYDFIDKLYIITNDSFDILENIWCSGKLSDEIFDEICTKISEEYDESDKITVKEFIDNIIKNNNISLDELDLLLDEDTETGINVSNWLIDPDESYVLDENNVELIEKISDINDIIIPPKFV